MVCGCISEIGPCIHELYDTALGHLAELTAQAESCGKARVAPACQEICPTCGRPFRYRPSRFCFVCKEPIMKGHKWITWPDGTIRHRNCGDPTSYFGSDGRRVD